MKQKHLPRILFVGLDYADVAHESNLHTELVEELFLLGARVQVVAPALDTERTGLREEGSIKVLRVTTGRLFNVGLVRKALSNLLLPLHYFLALRRNPLDWTPDWIVTPTPPITLTPLVWWLKLRTGAKSYLILRDIFPQNAVDLGFMSPSSFIHGFFRVLEKWTYAMSDLIGCMSQGNINYVLSNNKGSDPQKLHLLPNWIAERHVADIKPPSDSLRAEWGFNPKDLLCVFGGNLGKPQQVSFLMNVAMSLRNEQSIRIVIIGRGTEAGSIQQVISEQKLQNVIIHEWLPRAEYQQLLSIADIGFILLNKNFSIPNIPSRLTGYWAAGVGVLAATDIATDLNDAFLSRYGGGEWVRMGDIEAFSQKLRWYAVNREFVKQMGERGRSAVLECFTAKKAARSVLEHISFVD